MVIKKEILGTNVEIKNGKYQWHKSKKNDYIDFIYDDIKGTLIIEENIKEKRKLIISYNNKQKEIKYSKIVKLQISNLLYNKKEFKFEIGYKYKNTKSICIIIDRFIDNGKKYKVKCLKCGYIFVRSEHEIDKENYGCSICSGQIVVKGMNDMWTTNPNLASLLANPKYGYEYTENSNHKLNWKCPDCGNLIYNKTPATIKRQGLGCKSCSNGISYPNRFIFNLLKELNINFDSEKIFDWSNNKIYDFYLPDYNMIIEAHGMQHYKNCGFPIDVKEQQKNDKYKKEIAIKNGIDKYVIIDCRYSDKDFIMKNIKNSLLNEIFDLSKIDVEKINKKSNMKIIFEIVEMYKNNIGISKIAKKYNLSNLSIYNYLHKAEKMNLVKFDYERTKQVRSSNSHKTYYQKYSIPFKCIENECCFGSLSFLEKNSEKVFGKKILKSCICVALKNNKQSYGYTFKYITREEFNHQKEINSDKTFGDKFFDITINEK